MPSEAAIDRQWLAENFSRAMKGLSVDGDDLPFDAGRGSVKTYAIEVNDMLSESHAIERAERLAAELDLELASTEDSALALVWGEGGGYFLDVLDPRFWLLHTTSSAAWAYKNLRTALRTDRDLDWCWFPGDLLSWAQRGGQARWVKSDFEGDELLPLEGAPARRVRIQLEGDDVAPLYDELLASERYKHATALTSVATRISDPDLGSADELAHARGRFVTRGDSFELHLGFVSQTVDAYRNLVEGVEQQNRLVWEGDENGAMFEGEVLMIDLGRPVPDFERFVWGLFSCKEPFRLWSVPRFVGDEMCEAEVVDLHVGQRFRMDIAREWIRVYLNEASCGNTVFRLLTNLQHRYDARIGSPALAGIG